MDNQTVTLAKDDTTFTITANNQTLVLTRRQMHDLLRKMPAAWLKR